MEKDFISFHPNKILVSQLYFRDTPKENNLANQLLENNIEYEDFFEYFSSQKSFIGYCSKDQNKQYIVIFTEKGGVKFGYHDNVEDMFAISYIPYSFKEQNKLMKYGICIGVKNHVMFESRFYGRPTLYYLDGTAYVNLDREKYISENGVVWNKLLEYSRIEKEEDEEVIENSKGLEELLELAQNYSELEFNLEQTKVNTVGDVNYYSIQATEYNRVDRSACEIHISLQYKEIFIEGVSIEVYKQDNSKEIAEIIGVKLSDSECILTVLFNKQTDFSEFAKNGYIRLSSSTVNRDVQQTAVKKIQSRKSSCQYLDHLIGEKKSLGFDNKNLSDLTVELNKKKYPPNASQMKAILSGINVKDAYLVLGPPGTGKTTVISEWVKYFIEVEGKRVLVSSQNNKAVDNVLERLGENENIITIRIGSESKIQENVKKHMYENKMSQLRDTISDSCSKNMETLQKEWKLWYSFKKNVESGLSEIQANQKDIEYFDLYLKNEIFPIYNELLNLLRKYEMIEFKLVELNQAYKDSKKFLREFESFSMLKKILNSIKKSACEGSINNAEKNYYRLKNEEQGVRDRYTRLYAEYDNIIKYQSHQYFLNYQNSIEKTTKTFIELNENQPFVDSFGLFENCTRFRITYSKESLAKLYETLNVCLNKCRGVMNVISNWKNMILDRQNYALGQITLDSVNLVGATCIGINSQKRFSGLDFDVTIIDEAGQIQVHNALVPMSMSNKLIMLGDYQQIPPMMDQDLKELCDVNDVDTKLLKSSLFEVLYKDYVPDSNKILLDEQYRMPAEIADLISRQFYEGQYKSFKGKCNMQSLYPSISEYPFVFVDTGHESNRFEMAVPGKGCSNDLEAHFVCSLLKKVYKLDPDLNFEENVGVITPYGLQAKNICKGLSSFILKPEIMVATVDSFQGQERDLIIYSFTRSNKKDSHKIRIGFMNELRRLNVAMSRCKKMLILVGDYDFLKSCMHEDEREFSGFMRMIGEDLQRGKGEFISYKKMMDRLGGDVRG